MIAIAETVVNPEAMVRAAVAANEAANAAYYASMLATITLGAVLILGALIVFMAFKFHELVRHTNGMMQSLLEMTDKVGRAAGRQEQKDEDAAAKGKER
jgi:hypothetical protein